MRNVGLRISSRLIPHSAFRRSATESSMRWIWIDRFVAFESGKSATAVKNLSLAEDHFADHFPGYPVMPAPLILEGLAQTGGILVGEANEFTKKVVLAKIPKATFHREALAGETLTYTTTLPADGRSRRTGRRDRPRRRRADRARRRSSSPTSIRSQAQGPARDRTTSSSPAICRRCSGWPRPLPKRAEHRKRSDVGRIGRLTPVRLPIIIFKCAPRRGQTGMARLRPDRVF